jgi:NAD(P)-dependent dehydrogenase (short-subunit alcohol dehydrogenase family)
MDRNLEGKVTIITGAGGGIGSATAERFAQAGALLALADIDEAAVHAVAERLNARGARVRPFVTDIARESDVQALIDGTVAAFGRIDVVHNNAAKAAGQGQDGTVTEQTIEVWDRTFATNVRGPMLLCKHAIPRMIERGAGGVVINTSSQAADAGQADSLTAYGASKGALNTLTLYVSAQFAKHRIRCNAVAPGAVLTEGLKRLLPPQHIEAMARSAPLGEPSMALDIAAMVHFLASDDARLITGRIFRV